MAEAILFDIAASFIERLGSRVFQEIGMASKVGDEITRLKETMRLIKAVLLDAEEQHGKNNRQVTEWLLTLKEAVYDADDLVDDFTTELQIRQEEVCICFSKSNLREYSLKMAHKIKTIRERLEAIKNDRQFLLPIERPIERPIENTTRQTHSFVRADDVIGREEDKNIIIQRLLDTNDVESLSVIPIVGIGGLGKTTLAQYVYNDENVKNHFQLRMWVCVSDVFDERIIVKDIIKNIENSSSYMNVESLDNLRKDLHRLIDGKKYLLVLDDIWNENSEKWLKLEILLIKGMKGSKILITTRSQRVARITSKLQCHVLKGLNEDQSWFLFTQMAFEGEIDPKSSDLVNIGKCIVKKCRGVPLAIRVIGRLLYYTDRRKWLRFKENELSQIEDQEADDILLTLKLSYDKLPSHLKQCFAYCALFPKDYEIKKDYLVDLWIAQGFIQSSNINDSLEAIGNDYFMDLLSRSLFQDVERDEWGDVISCKMHDLMYDLATKVARSECTLLKSGAKNDKLEARHISFDRELSELPRVFFEKYHFRTFLMPLRLRNDLLNEFNFCKILSSFIRLRTLDLKCLNVKKLPNSIGKLKHLRYLDLSWNQEIKELPNSMSRLKNLQILKLEYCRSLKNLPRDIRKMVSLRCLMMEGCLSLIGIPRGLRLLTNLRTLSTLVLGSQSRKYAELDELNGLNNLSGSLAIRGLENVNSKHLLLADLRSKKNLVYLRLGGLYDDRRFSFNEKVLECLQPHPHLKGLKIWGFMGTRISSWLSSLTNLTQIEIAGCKRCQNIPRLDQLPSLKYLELSCLDDIEYMVSEKESNDSSSISLASFFPSLDKLFISYCPKLKGWWIDVDNDDGAMDLPSFPCLVELSIVRCPNMSCLPLYPSVENLALFDSSFRSMEQTMKLKNIAAVPSTSSTVTAPFSKLNSLSFERYQDLDFLTNVDDKQWKGFTSLNSISFWGISELVSLPQWLQHVPNLQELEISQCPKLMDLPEEMMQLQVLKIEQCPQLKERCGNDKGVDWPKISHIQNIKIDKEWVQKDGCYKSNTEGSSSASTAS